MLHSLYPLHPAHSLPPSPPLHPNAPFSAQNGQLRLSAARRRRKPHRNPNGLVFVRSHFNDASLDIISNFLPPVVALGLASAFAISLPKLFPFRTTNSDPESLSPDLGKWILFISPTPFNRFVVLRCPSISVEGSDKDVNERLVRDDRHYVRVDSGRMKGRERNEGGRDGGGGGGRRREIEYQRVCVGTDDGGVISLDWPENLDLEEENGLDTTVLVVPGTPDGSMDKDVMCFVAECLKRGLFPVVMNPRGCAGSPLTTPRLFTAADSDDVSLSVQFLNRARPCSTLMAVGYGFGANMLAKHLAEAGEGTPLTAAACIDNPFDLEEATRTAPCDSAINRELTRGMINILKWNKELFQGRKKEFDVAKALSAESFRDFDKAISTVSYGFSTVEEFYSNSSTRTLVGKLKIPVLFIQSDDGTVPKYSVPHGSIAENPFTSLLMCSLPSYMKASCLLVMPWCQLLMIEWLTAVELGFLKGRHPLVEDLDVSIKPSNGLTLMEGRASDTNEKSKGVFNFNPLDSSIRYFIVPENIFDGGTAENLLGNGNGSHNDWVPDHKDSAEVKEADPVGDESDQGQMLQTAEVVMNVLDVTMPGTLKEEGRKKVLDAVGCGETLLKALQDAVPEDVRGKLTNSVSEILQSQGKNMNFGLSGISEIASISSGLKHKLEEKLGKGSLTEGESDANYPSYQRSLNYAGDSPGSNDAGVNISSGKSGLESLDVQPQENSFQSFGLVNSRISGSNSDTNEIPRRGSHESQGDQNGLDSVREGGFQLSGSVENDSETNSETSSVPDTNPNNRFLDDEAGKKEDGTTPQMSSFDAQVSGKNYEDKGNKDEEVLQPVLEPPKPNSVSDSPTFSVTQALDALTGLDDSTQLAVNSVFSVIENMITQIEEDNKRNTSDTGHEMEADTSGYDSIKWFTGDELQSEKSVVGNVLEEVGPSLNSLSEAAECNDDFLGRETSEVVGKQIWTTDDPVSCDLESRIAVFHRNPVNLPFHVPTTISYGDAVYRAWHKKYLLPKMQQVVSLDLDSTTALSLDYIPEEGKWKVREQQEIDVDSSDDTDAYEGWCRKEIKPSYVVLNSERHQEPALDFVSIENLSCESGDIFADLTKLIRSSILYSMLVMVHRRLPPQAMKVMEPGLMKDIEDVANVVSFAVISDENLRGELLNSSNDHSLQLLGRFLGEHLTEALFVVVTHTSYLRRVLPVGVIIGSCCASLRNIFRDVYWKSGPSEALNLDENCISMKLPKDQLAAGISDRGVVQDSILEKPPGIYSGKSESNTIDRHKEGNVELGILNGETAFVGAVTAAIRASALLEEKQDADKWDNARETSLKSISTEVYHKRDPIKLEEAKPDKHQNMVASLAEKAMLVASPIVPTKRDGEVDQDRLVAMLAGLGQKGGILKLISKIALLWGGLRGAISLTDRLIMFLRIAERPLYQRILGFLCLVLVIWSPVVVPLLPTIVQNWATQNPYKIVEVASIIGLYVAVSILIIIWGKRIRGHENPLQQYGLDMASSVKVQDFLTGLVAGLMLVLSVHSMNAFLGYARFSWPTHFGSTVNVAANLKAYGKLFILSVRGIVTATCIATVEELLFRSWLPDEIAMDFGFHSGIIISGLAFSLSQRSLEAIPGLWMLSLSLSGIRHLKKGSLYIPIGLRTGIIASNFTLQMCGFLIYQPKLSLWVVGTHPFQPFSGAVCLLISLLSAIALYPRKHTQKG